MARSATTYFGTPGRRTPHELAAEAGRVRSAGLVTDILEGLPGPTSFFHDVLNTAQAELPRKGEGS